MKILVFLLLVLLIFIVLFHGDKNPTYIRNNDILSNEGIQDECLFGTIKALNMLNSDIKNITYSNVDMKITDKISTRVHGTLSHEKHKKLRMIVYSFTGTEMDLGSNNNQFWFWVKRMRPPTLYYASNGAQTNLRIPFHPAWIMRCLSVGEIDLHNSKVIRYGNYVKITCDILGYTEVTLVDPNKLVIMGNYIHDNTKVIASSENLDFYYTNGHYVPKKVKIIWNEENIEMDWDLNEPLINREIDDQVWEMPNFKNKIDISLPKFSSYDGTSSF